MPRFAERGASIYEAPGLTPALLGSAMTLAGLLLVVRRKSGDTESDSWDEIMASPDTRYRAGFALLLTVTYGVLLFGRLPYLLATIAFVFAFIIVFEWSKLCAADQRLGQKITRVLIAACIALFASFSTHYLFKNVFLVQLP